MASKILYGLTTITWLSVLYLIAINNYNWLLTLMLAMTMSIISLAVFIPEVNSRYRELGLKPALFYKKTLYLVTATGWLICLSSILFPDPLPYAIYNIKDLIGQLGLITAILTTISFSTFFFSDQSVKQYVRGDVIRYIMSLIIGLVGTIFTFCLSFVAMRAILIRSKVIGGGVS